MTLEIFCVESANLYVAIAAGKIVQIQKATDAHINPHAIRVDCFDATTERTHVRVADRKVYMDKSKLYLDAWALTDFAGWLRSQMPSASIKKFGNAFFDYFPGSMIIADVVAGAGRIVCAPDLKRPPQGDETYYVAKARASDPDGFASLAVAWAERQQPSH